MANSHLNPVLLSAYIDNEVSAEERSLVESHLVTCETCQVELDALRWTANLFDQLPDAPLPRNFYITEAMLEESIPLAKKGWIEWLQSLFIFNNGQSYPIGIGAAVVALLLLMVVVQPFSTTSESQLVQAPLSTAPLVNEEAPELALRAEESASTVEETVVVEKEAIENSEVIQEEAIEAETNEQVAASSARELESESGVLTEEESGAFFEAILATDEAEEAPQPPEATYAARPQRAVAATATLLEQIEQTTEASEASEALSTPTLRGTDTDSVESDAESTYLAEESQNSLSSSPIPSGADTSVDQQSTPQFETDLLSPQSNQSAPMIFMIIGILLLAILGGIYWQKQSD